MCLEAFPTATGSLPCSQLRLQALPCGALQNEWAMSKLLRVLGLLGLMLAPMLASAANRVAGLPPSR
jgi:hypothetical protein